MGAQRWCIFATSAPNVLCSLKKMRVKLISGKFVDSGSVVHKIRGCFGFIVLEHRERYGLLKGLQLSKQNVIVDIIYMNGIFQELCRMRKMAKEEAWRMPRQDQGVAACNQLHPTFCDPMDYSCQEPLSVGFSRQEYWSGLPFPTPGDFPSPGIDLSFLLLLHWQRILNH